MAKKTHKINKKVVVAMSGGVDSSVSAALLKEQGYDVIGVFMRVWSEGDQCPWIEDQFEARRAAEHLGIPLYTINLEKEYKKAVVDYFFREYAGGRTPNPDVLCNSEIKFGVFLKRMLEMGADCIATGHYARLSNWLKQPSSESILASSGDSAGSARSTDLPHTTGGVGAMPDQPPRASSLGHAFAKQNSFNLLRGLDPKKDQTYFLWKLTQDQLKHIIFPVGGYTKSHVRVLAKKFGLPNANRKDSQGICFIGPVDIQEFLKTRLPVKVGKVITTDGQPVGEHEGVWFYTIGQRHGWVPVTPSSDLAARGSDRFAPSGQATSHARSNPQSVTELIQGQVFSLRHRLVSIEKNRPALYVVDKDLKNNMLIVGQTDDPKLWARGMTLTNVHWLVKLKVSDERSEERAERKRSGGMQTQKPKLQCQIRYQQKPIGCQINNLNQDQVEVRFNEPIRAVTPGQSAVFYSGDILLGGGVIEQAINKPDNDKE